jgi:hypothetical protein
MPLTGTGDILGLAIKAAIHGLTDEQKQDPDTIFKAMGNAIIAHIIANGTGATVTLGTAGATPLPGNII